MDWISSDCALFHDSCHDDASDDNDSEDGGWEGRGVECQMAWDDACQEMSSLMFHGQERVAKRDMLRSGVECARTSLEFALRI